jgi:hypothetical protein
MKAPPYLSQNNSASTFASPFSAKSRSAQIPAPDLTQFKVDDDYSFEALQYYENQQQWQDSFEWWMEKILKDPSQTSKKSPTELYDMLRAEMSAPFHSTPKTPTNAMLRRPATITVTQPAIYGNPNSYNVPNTRPWEIRIDLHRNHTGPALRKWFEKEGIPQLRELIRTMAHGYMRGSIELSRSEAIKYRERYHPHATGNALIEEIQEQSIRWRNETVAQSRKQPFPSDYRLKVHLCGLAYYRYRQAGFGWRQFAIASKAAQLEDLFVARSENDIEKILQRRLRRARQRQLDLWLQSDGFTDPSSIPGIYIA